MTPPNALKAEVGNGGLSENILNKAQALDNSCIEFAPWAAIYLDRLMSAIGEARNPEANAEQAIAEMLYPVMQLKANGRMFGYPLVTQAADCLVRFLEAIEEPDIDALEIVLAFQAALRAVITAGITGTGGREGAELMSALDDACRRYFDARRP